MALSVKSVRERISHVRPMCGALKYYLKYFSSHDKVRLNVSQKIIAHHFFYVNYLIKLVNFTLVNFVCCKLSCCKSQFFMSVGSISW